MSACRFQNGSRKNSSWTWCCRDKNLRDGTINIVAEAEGNMLKEFRRKKGGYTGFKRIYYEETVTPEEQTKSVGIEHS